MRYEPLPLPGAYRLEPEPSFDARGSFARLFDAAEFAARGLCDRFPQVSLSHNERRGTLRGLHYQAAPHGEAKLVTCVRGAAFDVLVDLRPGPGRLRWHAEELSAANRRLLYVPEGLAHGFLALQDDTALLYQISAPHQPEAARGLRWDDPALAIPWPLAPTVLSERDRAWPLEPR